MDKPTEAQRLLQICEARKRAGRQSVIMVFPSWPKGAELFPPGLLLGEISGKHAVLFDLSEMLDTLRFMVEVGK